MLHRVDGTLVAVGVVDVLPRCLSSVYLFYDPAWKALAPGKLSALKEAQWVRSAAAASPQLKWYYLGYYVHSCHKMRYKAQYSPSEMLCHETWRWFPAEECIAKLEEGPQCVGPPAPGSVPRVVTPLPATRTPQVPAVCSSRGAVLRRRRRCGDVLDPAWRQTPAGGASHRGEPGSSPRDLPRTGAAHRPRRGAAAGASVLVGGLSCSALFRDGEGRRVRLSIQECGAGQAPCHLCALTARPRRWAACSCLDRGLGCGQVQPPLPLHTERVQPRVQVHHRGGIRDQEYPHRGQGRQGPDLGHRSVQGAVAIVTWRLARRGPLRAAPPGEQ